jgi:hypothetical protein
VRIGRDPDGWLPVLHLRLFNPTDDHYGFPPLEAAAFAVDVHNASGAWNKALLDNAARPSGALVYGAGQPLSAEQFDRLKANLQAAHSGHENAGRPLLLEGGLDWKPMSLSPADMDYISGKHAAAREIALAFGVPPQLLGIPGDATYANYKEAKVAFWRGHGGAPGAADGAGADGVAGAEVPRRADRGGPGGGAGAVGGARGSVGAAGRGELSLGRGAATHGGGGRMTETGWRLDRQVTLGLILAIVLETAGGAAVGGAHGRAGGEPGGRVESAGAGGGAAGSLEEQAVGSRAALERIERKLDGSGA